MILNLNQFKANYMHSDARLQQLEFRQNEAHRGFTKTFRNLVSELNRQSLFLRELLNDDDGNNNLLTESEIKKCLAYCTGNLAMTCDREVSQLASCYLI